MTSLVVAVSGGKNYLDAEKKGKKLLPLQRD